MFPRRRGHEQIRHTELVAAPIAPTELTRPSSDRFIDPDPPKRVEEPLGGSALRRAETDEDLGPAHLAAQGHGVETDEPRGRCYVAA